MSKVQEALSFIGKEDFNEPEVGIILGTGLGGLAKEIDVKLEIPYDSIPDFPVSTVESHSGKFLFGSLEGKNVVVMQGRFHYYEGYSLEEVVRPLRVMGLLGIKKLLVSNAAGGLNPSYAVSDLMVLNDHINLIPGSPIRGKEATEFGTMFPDMSRVYDQELIGKAISLEKKLEVGIHQGVYVAVSGPHLETPAEYKYLRNIGADAVGMSTTPEIIAAVQMGIKQICGISVITDLGVPGKIKPLVISDVLAAAAKAEPELIKLTKALIA